MALFADLMLIRLVFVHLFNKWDMEVDLNTASIHSVAILTGLLV